MLVRFEVIEITRRKKNNIQVDWNLNLKGRLGENGKSSQSPTQSSLTLKTSTAAGIVIQRVQEVVSSTTIALLIPRQGTKDLL